MGFASALHKHDLLAYATAMKIGFEIDDPSFDPVIELHDLEMLVTARLRNASATWVRTAIEGIFCAGLGFMVMATVLLFQRGMIVEDLVLIGFIMVIAMGMCASIGWPLASVAETFEYDVLR